MRILADTNVFLEILLDQARAGEARALLAQVRNHEFFLSDYALHSIGVLLFRRKQPLTFRAFLQDVIVGGAATVVSLSTDDMEAVIDAARRFNFDFDDAYQYVTAEKFGLRIVTYDSDFDRVPDIRLLPKDLPEA